MPRQNRVTPFGELVTVTERGTMMGNRGVLHDHEGRIRRPWQVKRWLICRLNFKERHRQVMAPDRYTELFFLDEATGLAAGHRPCVECRRSRFLEFRDAWASGGSQNPDSESIKVATIDVQLHSERVGPNRSKRTFVSNLNELPDGVMVLLGEESNTPYLIWQGQLLAWTPGGYEDRLPRPCSGTVRVLTPASTVQAIRKGYVPEVHQSAGIT
ncbi:MAG TPA: hypothetical protein VFT74_02125 [Isosphaeraceae bacterium]|nr:hypothetical protein [Isosphaeraceae bacterium]